MRPTRMPVPPSRRHRPWLLLAGLLLALGSASCGADGSAESTDAAQADRSGRISVSEAWVRATKGTDDPSMTAAFMAITNGTDADVRLLGATTPVTDMVQVHEMVMADDGHPVMQQATEGITIRAGKEQLLMPGGFHVMLMGLTDVLAPGQEVALTLEFSDGTTLEVTAPVKAFTEEEGHYHSHSASPSPSADPS